MAKQQNRSSLNPQNLQEALPVDTALQELVSEAEILFNLLDSTSASIRKFEKSLSDLKAYFSFRLCIKEEKTSRAKTLTAEYKQSIDESVDAGHSFSTKIYWYLAWEADDTSKNFRLFLVTEEKVIINTGYEEDYYSYDLQTKVIFKRPLIETDIQTRLKYAEFLALFINAFRDNLKRSRILLEKGDLALAEQI